MSGSDTPARLQPVTDLEAIGPAGLVDRIKSERGRVSALYATLLHSPPIADGWLHFLTAIRRDSSLNARLRELVILRVAILNGAPYEFESHRPHALDAGMSALQVDALASGQVDGLFGPVEQAVIAYTDAMTRCVEVPDPVYAAVRAALTDRELVELTATVAAYNLVSRFLVALRVGGHGPAPRSA